MNPPARGPEGSPPSEDAPEISRKVPSWLARLSSFLGVDTAPDPVRFGSAMLRDFGWLYWVLGLGPALRRVRFEDHSSEHVRAAASTGPIVYVLLRRSPLDHLTLNTVLNRRRLPLSVWAHGTFSFPWQPIIPAWLGVMARLYRRITEGPAPDPVKSGWLSKTVASGDPVTIFLQDQGGPFQVRGGDPMQAILDAQEQLDQPIHLLPVIAVWDRAPERDMPVRNFILGSRENPGLFSTMLNLYSPVGRAPFVQVGKPLDLAELTRRVPESRRLETLRVLLRRYLRREGRVVRGPTLLPRRVLQQLVLDNPPMQAFAREDAATKGTSVEKVRKAMAKEFDAIAANFSWFVIWSLSYVCRPLWNRVYSGYDIGEEDLDRIRSAVRDGTAVLVPCHKSHFDYLLMSWVLYHHDLVPPHVVAGNNLNIWPLSIILRGAGGFFIRRSFGDDRVHPVVFERYIRELIRQEYTVEFFIEGGRSRSGKLLRPRLGVLEMVLDASAKGDVRREVSLLPVSIVYEQIAEAGAYRSELGGAAKKTEDMGQVLRAGGVLRRRFGRVYVRVGEPIKASNVIGEPESWLNMPPEKKRETLRYTGETLIRSIGQVVVMLPTTLVALGALSQARRAFGHEELYASIRRFRSLFQQLGLQEAASLQHFDQAISQALDRCVSRGLLRNHMAADKRVWEVPPEQRMALGFHQNEVLHAVAPAALAAASMRSAPGVFRLDDLLPTYRQLEETLDREFTFDPDLDTPARLEEALGVLVEHGALIAVDGGWSVSDASRLSEVHALLRGLLESYLLVLTAMGTSSSKLDKKAWVKEIQGEKDRWIEEGIATRPEAFSAVSLRNALTAFVQQGVVEERDGRISALPDACRERRTLLATAAGT